MVCTPKVSISILNWNGKDTLIECLSSIEKLDYPIYQVIITDNGSTDGSVEFIKSRFSKAIVIENEKNYGVIIARNMGLNKVLSSAAEYVLLVDNDIIVHPSLLRSMIEVMLSDKTIGVAGAKLYHYDHSDTIFSAGGYINYTQNIHGNRGANQKDLGQFDKLEEVDSLGFACMLIRCSILGNTGLLDPKYIGYGFGDTDFCVRVRRAGYKIMFCPTAKAWHKYKDSTSNKRYTFRKKYLEARNAIRFVKKYGTLKDRAKYGFFVGLGIPYAFIREGARGNLGGVIGKVFGLFDGLRGRDDFALRMFESNDVE